MAIALQYNPEKKILYATIIDKLISSEFADTLKEISDSDEYPSDVGILWDASSINTSIGNKQCELDLIEIQKRFPEGGKAKIAIITSSDFTFGMRQEIPNQFYGRARDFFSSSGYAEDGDEIEETRRAFDDFEQPFL